MQNALAQRLELACRLTCLSLALNVCAVAFADESTNKVDFDKQIRPILSNHCYQCHGPDENHREAGIRFDDLESAFSDDDFRDRILVPGDPGSSELIVRVFDSDETSVMPPPEANKPLTEKQKLLLLKWVKSGAEYEKHWSLSTPVKAITPQVDSGRVANEIDAFVLNRLSRLNEQSGDGPQGESEQLTEGGFHFSQSPQADKRSLLRRVTLDLTGLPPSPADYDAFLDDDSSDAYEKTVDRLLDSSQYGEHMARYWLDLVRYADTHGMHFDNYREMWPYRDWVIQSFNENKPYSDFIAEQLAGDLFDNPSREQLIASGFNRLNVTTNEGGSIYDEVFIRNVSDRTEAFGTVFLGMTVGCAVCHDHKFDPITQKDFYALSAYFNSLDGRAMDENRKDHEPSIMVPSPEQDEQLRKVDAGIAMAMEEFELPNAELDRDQQTWEQQMLAASDQSQPQFQLPAAVNSSKSTESSGLDQPDVQESESEEDDDAPVADDSSDEPELPHDAASISLGDWHSAGPFEDTSVRAATGRTYGGEGGEFKPGRKVVYRGETIQWQQRPELTDGLVHALPEYEDRISAVVLYREIDSPIEQTVDVLAGTTDGIRMMLNGKSIIRDEILGPHVPFSTKVRLKLKKGRNDFYLKSIHSHAHGPAEFSFVLQSRFTQPTGVMRDIASIAPDDRSVEESRMLRRFYRLTAASGDAASQLRQQMMDAVEAKEELQQSIPTTLIYLETEKARPAHVLIRGEYDNKGDRVDRNVPSFLPPMDESLPENRLGLARWLADPKHPLTTRVAVNRFWQQIFGRGIVKTSEDFGAQGEPPSHPELLDWLAVDFRQNGWDIKRLMKQIVISETYQQSSVVSPALLAADPMNQWLSRGPRHRLDAETIRDQALAVAGLLNGEMGGPSVKPPQPDGLWEAVGFTNSDTAKFEPSVGESIYRRSVYVFWKRTAHAPTMATFDAPSRESCTARRERTNTPLQALLLLNEPVYLESARALAAKVEGEIATDDSASIIATMFEQVLGRLPDDFEAKQLDELFRDVVERLRDQPKKVDEIIDEADDESNGHESETLEARVQQAGRVVIANMLLNLDEFITKH